MVRLTDIDILVLSQPLRVISASRCIFLLNTRLSTAVASCQLQASVAANWAGAKSDAH